MKNKLKKLASKTTITDSGKNTRIDVWNIITGLYSGVFIIILIFLGVMAYLNMLI